MICYSGAYLGLLTEKAIKNIAKHANVSPTQRRSLVIHMYSIYSFTQYCYATCCTCRLSDVNQAGGTWCVLRIHSVHNSRSLKTCFRTKRWIMVAKNCACVQMCANQTTIGFKGRKHGTLLISSMTVGVSQQYCCFEGYKNLHIAGTTVSKALSWLPRRHNRCYFLMPDKASPEPQKTFN